jgi:hypothetical protein
MKPFCCALRRDVMPANAGFARAVGIRGQFRALSLTIMIGRPHWWDEVVQLAGRTSAGDRSVGDRRETFPGAIVDYRQDPEASAISSRTGVAPAPAD